MELKIYSPTEEGFLKSIEWHHEEIKREVAERVRYYKNLAYTDDQIADAKKDRATLNKFVQELEATRKAVKKQCLAPYEDFEKKIKEIVQIVNEPIQLIDQQIKAADQLEKDEKKKAIEKLFVAIGFQPFVTLDMIWDEKWLNKSASLTKVESQLKEIMYRIGEEIGTIHSLPEFSFEAMEVYKKTLDLTQAIKKGQELADIQKRKEEALARQKAEEERRKAEEAAAGKESENPEDAADTHDAPKKAEENDYTRVVSEPVMRIDFRVWGTKEQILALRDYMKQNNLKFGKVE